MNSVRPGRSHVGGLPQGPRSRSVGRDRERERPSIAPSSYTSRSAAVPAAPPVPGLPRQIRPQRSLANVPSSYNNTQDDYSSSRNTRERSRTREHSLPRGGRITRDEYAPRQSNDLPPRESSRYHSDRTSVSSHSSASSGSGSSLLERMKSRSGSGYASSRTSLESDAEMPKGRGGPDSRGRGGWLKEREPTRAPSPDYEREQQPTDNTSSEGYSVWNRVAEAASSLTINVSKAWATNIATFSGEQTPPGQESHLIRAMKAYHLEKARDPSDLPDWLFDEHERRPARATADRSGRNNYNSDERDRDYEPAPTSRRGAGLRDIYDRAAASASPPPQRAPSRSRFHDTETEERSSKASDRLKALREAKRTAVQRNATVSRRADEVDDDRGRGRASVDDHEGRSRMRMPMPETPVRRPPMARTGLPTRPMPAAQRAF